MIDLKEFVFTEKELAAKLEITVQELDEIISFFDANPNDEWDLEQGPGKDFEFENKTKKIRRFSKRGAFTLARYLKKTRRKSFFGKLKEFIFKKEKKVTEAFVREVIQENCRTLTLRNNRHFLSQREVVKIMATNPTRLKEAFNKIQRSPLGMVQGEDFDEFEEEIKGKLVKTRHYSLSGLDKLSRELAFSLTKKARREWCDAVSIIAQPTFKLLISEEEARASRIKKAMAAAKKRDKSTCQVTGEKPDKYNSFNLAVHHLYCSSNYPHLAESLDNLITIKEEIHHKFHISMGGFDKVCTMDDFIKFVQHEYPSSFLLSVLIKRKRVFGLVSQVA